MYMAFHVFQGKYRPRYKKIPLILFIAGVWKGEEIPNSIPDHMLTALIPVGIDGYCWIYFPRNTIKLGRACILRACLLCISLLFKGPRTELTIMYRSYPLLEFFIIMISWNNPIISLFGPSEAIHLGIWVCSHVTWEDRKIFPCHM